MKILKGDYLVIRHSRKGKFYAVATQDFDTADEWYFVSILEPVQGINNKWEPGEEIPCRGSFCSDVKKLDVLPIQHVTYWSSAD